MISIVACRSDRCFLMQGRRAQLKPEKCCTVLYDSGSKRD